MPAYDPRILNTKVTIASRRRSIAFVKSFLIVKEPRPEKRVKFKVQKVKKKYSK